jgi:hypothetical protein
MLSVTLIIVILIVAGILSLVMIGLYGGEKHIISTYPQAPTFTNVPDTTTPSPEDNTYPQPDFQLIGSQYIENLAPCITWNDEINRGAYIQVVDNSITSIHFLHLNSNGNVVIDLINLPQEVNMNFYNGTTMKIIKDLKTSTFILLLSGITVNERGIVNYFLLQDGIWSTETVITQSPRSIDGDQFGKNIGVVYDLLSQRTFICFSSSFGIANQYGEIQLWNYIYPNNLSWEVSLDILPTTGFSEKAGFGNALAYTNGTILIGCPGYIQDDGSVGHVYHFIFNFTTGHWEQALGIKSVNQFGLGSSLQINDSGDRLLVGVPGVDGELGSGFGNVLYLKLNGDKDGGIGWDLISTLEPPVPINQSLGIGLRFGQVIKSTSDMRYIIISNNAPNNEQYIWAYRLDVDNDVYLTSDQSTSFNTSGDPEAIDIYTKTSFRTNNIIYLTSPFSVGIDNNFKTCNLIGVNTVHSHIVHFQMLI